MGTFYLSLSYRSVRTRRRTLGYTPYLLFLAWIVLLHHSSARSDGSTRDAPALIALHGGLGWDSASLRPFLDPLAEHVRLTFADLRGCGASRAPEDDDPTGAAWSRVTHADWADDVEELRAHLDGTEGGHERVVLFGHSYGTVIALEYALRYPDRVAGLILCAPVFSGERVVSGIPIAQRRAAQAGERTDRALATILSGPPQTDEAFGALVRDALPIYVYNADAYDLDAFWSRGTWRAAPAKRSFYELVGSYDVRPLLPQIAAPTLLLVGRHDWVARPDDVAEDVAALRDTTLHTFEQSGHLPFLEETEAFLQAVGEWLSALPLNADPPRT